jgi:hypothetical protein
LSSTSASLGSDSEGVGDSPELRPAKSRSTFCLSFVYAKEDVGLKTAIEMDERLSDQAEHLGLPTASRRGPLETARPLSATGDHLVRRGQRPPQRGQERRSEETDGPTEQDGQGDPQPGDTPESAEQEDALGEQHSGQGAQSRAASDRVGVVVGPRHDDGDDLSRRRRLGSLDRRLGGSYLGLGERLADVHAHLALASYRLRARGTGGAVFGEIGP